MIFKHKYLFWGVVFISLFLIVSCNKDNPAFNRENIKATWVANVYDGQEVSPDKYLFYTFDNSGLVTVEGIMNMDEGNYSWGATTALYYEVYCCSLEINGSASGLYDIPVTYLFSQEYDIRESNDSTMSLDITSNKIDVEEVDAGFATVTMTKLPKTFAATDSLSGLWQLNQKNGETDSSFQLRFASRGVLEYYTNIEGVWTLREENDDKFAVYSDFLVLNLFNNTNIGTADKWAAACFKILKASPFEKELTLVRGADTYSFVLVKEDL